MPASDAYPSREAFERDHANVKGTAIGPDRDGQRPTLIVLVTAKRSERDLDAADIIPDRVAIDETAYQTDVEPIGIPHALGTTTATTETTVADHRDRHRPIPGGVSIGNAAVGAGTMGSPLLKTEDGSFVTLTNAHVAGEAVMQFQPAAMDGGSENDPIGTLREASPLDPSEPQTTDSALIDVEPDDVSDSILGLGPLTGFGESTYDREVTKAGRTTGITTASLRGRDAAVNVAYGPETVRVTGCDVFGYMSDPGDSGSLIGHDTEDGFEATDLLFAGSDQATIGIPLPAVEEYHGDLSIPESDEDDEEDDTEDGEPITEWGQFRHPARLRRVVDGDTMDFEVHIGPLNQRQDHRIRLLEIDTAERGTDAFDAHKQFAAQWLAAGREAYGPDDDPADPDAAWPFVLATHRDELDAFGRLLTYVVRKTDGQDLTTALRSEFGEDVRYELALQLQRLRR